MNKAFVREPDQTADYCPRCGSQGDPVVRETLDAQLPPPLRCRFGDAANFCPAPLCEAVYFDVFERVVTAAELGRPVCPKDPQAPLCGCFGLTADDVERDLAEGGVTRVRALLEKAKSADAQCLRRAANGRSCVPFVQRYYMQRRGTR